MITVKPTSIDEYIASFPKDVQKMMEQIRATIRNAAPGAEEAISYGMPAFNLNDHYLVYFGGYKKHIGLYPVPTGNAALDKAYAAYKTSGKGTIRFPLDKPLPLDLITKIVQFNIKKNAGKITKK